MNKPRHLGFIVLAWTAAGILLAAQAYVSEAMRGRPLPVTRSLAVWLGFTSVWALLTPVVVWIARRFPFVGSSVIRALTAHAVGAAIVVTLQLALFAILAPITGATSAAGTWLATFQRLLGAAFILDLPLYALTVFVVEFARVASEARERERRALMFEAQLADARLGALRSQIQPHFLFNALNTVAVLMQEDVERAERVLVKLAGLLRKAVDTSQQHEVPLREEIEFVRAYLEIEQERFTDRLTTTIDVADDALDARVPSLILQPLVENAVRHGIARRAEPGRIEIAVRRIENDLHLTVRDNGPGFREGARDGVGLENTRGRLAELYGDQQSIEINSGPSGTTVSLVMPIDGRGGRV